MFDCVLGNIMDVISTDNSSPSTPRRQLLPKPKHPPPLKRANRLRVSIADLPSIQFAVTARDLRSDNFSGLSTAQSSHDRLLNGWVLVSEKQWLEATKIFTEDCFMKRK